MLAALFAWSEADFDQRWQGSPIRRIGHERWLRNIAVALGNAPATPWSLKPCRHAATTLSRGPGHVDWALRQQQKTPCNQRTSGYKVKRVSRLFRGDTNHGR